MNAFLESLKRLKIKNKSNINFKVLDLFSGCGGLALGFEARGFKTLGIEKNYDAVQTYKKNLSDCIEAELTIKTKFPHADVIIGGPPCQPFSVGGKQLGLIDSRDGFPIFIEAVEKLKPKLWLFENVRGMQFRNKLYLIEIIEKLKRLGYKVFSKILNAKEYGVPQSRERLFVIGSKVKWTKDGKELNGIVEKITDKSFKICCKPGKKSGDKGSTYMISKDLVSLI